MPIPGQPFFYFTPFPCLCRFKPPEVSAESNFDEIGRYGFISFGCVENVSGNHLHLSPVRHLEITVFSLLTHLIWRMK